MSILQMVKVWAHEFSHPEQSIMLALADHANDEGESIFPTIDRIGWKTGYERRNVQRIMKALKDKKILVVTREATYNTPTEYAINWNAATQKPPFIPPQRRGDILSPLKNVTPSEGVTSEDLGVTSEDLGVTSEDLGVTSEDLGVTSGDDGAVYTPPKPSINHQTNINQTSLNHHAQENEKKSDLNLGLNLESDLSNHKCWGSENEVLESNENSTTVKPSAEKAKDTSLKQETEKESARAGVSVAAASGKSKLEILNEMLDKVTAEHLPDSFRTECRSCGLLPWLDSRQKPNNDFALWLGRRWHIEGDKPSDADLLVKVHSHFKKAARETERLRELIIKWETYQLHLTELNEAAGVKSSDISAEAMALIQGNSNGRYKSLEVFEPRPWEPGDPIMLDEEEWAIPKNASREFVEGLKKDAALRREANEWYEMIEKIKSSIAAGKELSAKAFLNNLRMHVYNAYLEANQKSKTEPRNKYFDKHKIIETFRFAYDAGYESSVPTEVHRFCGHSASTEK